MDSIFITIIKFFILVLVLVLIFIYFHISFYRYIPRMWRWSQYNT